jgi:hypothetical protein
MSNDAINEKDLLEFDKNGHEDVKNLDIDEAEKKKATELYQLIRVEIPEKIKKEKRLKVETPRDAEIQDKRINNLRKQSREANEEYFRKYGFNITGDTIPESERQEDAKGQKYQEVIDLLTKAKPEIEDLYKGMMANQRQPDQENGETYEGNLRYAAEEWFDSNKDNYQAIANRHVLNPHLYYSSSEKEVPDLGHTRRDFQGKLCQVLIFDNFPNKYISDLSSPPQRFGIKTLYDLLKSL